MGLTLARKEYVLQTRYFSWDIDDADLELLNLKLKELYIGSKTPLRATYDTLIQVWESDRFLEGEEFTEKVYQYGEETTTAFWVIWDWLMRNMQMGGYDIDDESLRDWENFMEDCTV